MPIKAKVTAVEGLENLQNLCCGSHVGGQKNAHQPIFPYYIIQNYPTSLAHSSVLFGRNDFKFGTETLCMVLQDITKFGVN